jgi:hypothetical protein
MLSLSRFVVSGEGGVEETGNKRVDVAQAVAHQALKVIDSNPIPRNQTKPVLGEGARGVSKKKAPASGSLSRKPVVRHLFYSYIATP